jgi:hypothetical protein
MTSDDCETVNEDEPELVGVTGLTMLQLMEKHWKPPRRIGKAELKRWAEKGMLRDPQAPPVTRTSRVTRLLCLLGCDRKHCHRNGRCMHRLPIGLRENLHWLPRVLCEFHGDPIPRKVLVMERLYAEEAGLKPEPLPEEPEVDPFATIGGDEPAPLRVLKPEDGNRTSEQSQ